MNREERGREFPVGDSFGLGIMPILFNWMTPEAQKIRAQHVADLGRRGESSGVAGRIDIH